MIKCPRCNAASQPNAQFCSGCGVPFAVVPIKKKRTGLWLLTILGILALPVLLCGIFAVLFAENELKKDTPEGIAYRQVTNSMTDRDKALQNVSIDVNYGKSGFGSIMIGDVSVKNSSPYTIRDLVIECGAYGSSNTRIHTVNKTVYEVVPPMQNKTFKKINFGFINSQTDSVGCNLKDLTIVE